MYNFSVEKVVNDLKYFGFAKLPSIKELVCENNYFDIYKRSKTNNSYQKNSPAHLKLINDMGLELLFDELYKHGRALNLKISKDDRYLISRYVSQGQFTEGYRGHFDSHFITIVLPIYIPVNGCELTSGELLAIPNFRKQPANEIINIMQKAYYKRLNREKVYLYLVNNGQAFTFNFQDYEPLVFYGNRTFHGNFPLLSGDTDRLTFLCHLYDTSPKFGIGSVLRTLRNR